MLKRKLTLLAERLGDVHLLVLAGRDGIPVETVSFDVGFDAETLTAEMMQLGRDILHSYQELAVGRPRQFSISLGSWILMSSFVSRDYSLLLVADRRVGLSRARFELRRARLTLESELD